MALFHNRADGSVADLGAGLPPGTRPNPMGYLQGPKTKERAERDHAIQHGGPLGDPPPEKRIGRKVQGQKKRRVF